MTRWLSEASLAEKMAGALLTHEKNGDYRSVTDGAAFVTQGCYEPTLTIMAMSVRASDYIIDASKKREL